MIHCIQAFRTAFYPTISPAFLSTNSSTLSTTHSSSILSTNYAAFQTTFIATKQSKTTQPHSIYSAYIACFCPSFSRVF